MMVHLTIDGQPVEVEEGTTILQAAKKACIHIPTLCYHEDLSIKAVCRICVVEVEGQRLLPTACSTPVSEGMVVQTASPKVLKARRNILELIFARHPQECLVCPKDGKCDLQKVAQDVGMHLDIRYDKQLRHQKEDWSSPAIMRNPQKCILCGRCMEVCNEIQGINVLSKENRGFHTLIAPAYGEKLADTNCINCGQCVQVCPTGALTVHYHTYGLYRQKELGKKLIIQVAPSVRITLAEALGEQPGVVSTGRLVSALKRLGFYKVFDSDFSADLTIMEEGTELLNRLQNGGTLPMITSCCPAWVKYCETYAPEYTKHLSTAKSPQQMFGALTKTYYAEKMGLDPHDIVCVSVMPCTAKKFEIGRDDMSAAGDNIPDVDISITTRELGRMIERAGIKFTELPDEDFDPALGESTGAATIFGATGGVMEAALRTAVELVTGETLEKVEFHDVRGTDGIKEASYDVGGLHLNVCVASGLTNCDAVLKAVQSGEKHYDFIEFMACPGGCVNGGGQPTQPASVRNFTDLKALRAAALYGEDDAKAIRKSHENPLLKKVYAEYLGEPGGHKAHHILHTSYVAREKLY